MGEQIQVSREFSSFVTQALNTGIQQVVDGEPDPFLMLLDTECTEHLLATEVEDDDLEGAAESLREIVAAHSDRVRFYGLVYDAILTRNGVEHEVMIVEAGEHGQPTGYLVLQEYRFDEESGESAKLGEEEWQPAQQLLARESRPA